MRLINANALRESIITRQTEMSYEDAWALTCIDNAPTVEPQKWISVTEGLPKDGEEVQVTSGFEEPYIYVTDGKFSSRFGGWVSAWDNQPLYDVTAWMPLPKPYKDKGKTK